MSAPGQDTAPTRGVGAVFDALEVHDQAAAASLETARRINLALRVAADMRRELASLSAGDGRFATGLAYGDGAVARIVAALQGETDEAKLRFQGVIPLRPMPIEQTIEQLTMPCGVGE